MQKAIADLIQSELRLTYIQAVNNLDILINALDRKHRVVFWNKKAENYFGINKEFAIGNKFEEIVPYVVSNGRLNLIDEVLDGKTIFVEKEKYMKRTAYYQQKIIPVYKEEKIVAALNIVWDLPEDGTQV